MRSASDTHDMGTLCSIRNFYQNDSGGNTSSVGYHSSIWNITLDKRVGSTTIIHQYYFSVFFELSWYLRETFPWDSITTTGNQSLSTVIPAENWYPKRNYNWGYDNIHINGGHIIIMSRCDILLSFLWTPPYNKTTVINYFISNYTTLRYYGYGTIVRLFYCFMLV